MGLRITRASNTLIYGGFGLDLERLEDTYDHRIWFRSFTRPQQGERATALVSINTPTSIRDFTLTAMGSGNSVAIDDLVLTFLGTHIQDLERRQKCPECGTIFNETKKRMQGRFDFDAPRDYTILRDDVSANYE